MIETYKLIKRVQTSKNLDNRDRWNRRRYCDWPLLTFKGRRGTVIPNDQPRFGLESHRIVDCQIHSKWLAAAKREIGSKLILSRRAMQLAI